MLASTAAAYTRWAPGRMFREEALVQFDAFCANQHTRVSYSLYSAHRTPEEIEAHRRRMRLGPALTMKEKMQGPRLVRGRV
jgi:hypothetical protein